MKGESKRSLGLLAVGTLLACLAPLVFDMELSYVIYFLFLVYSYVALAQAWNLVAGYTGQVSLGQNAFFGVGAYVTAFLWRGSVGGYFDPLTMFLAGLSAAAIAVLVGIPLLAKLKGDYFALGTLGLGEILRVIILENNKVTGGASGLSLPSSSYAGMGVYYYCGLGLALFATLAVYFIMRSRVGLALVAIRDDEAAAAASGVYVHKYKVAAFAAGAFITGLCGNLQAYYLFHIDPSNFFGANWTLYPILICVLGAAGTVMGPIVGAFILASVFEVAKIWLPTVHPIVSGALIILVILFVPNGFLRLRLRRMIGLGGSPVESRMR